MPLDCSFTAALKSNIESNHMKIIAFAATSSTQSINKKLATLAANTFKETFNPNADIEILDLNDYEMPIYSSDRENADGIPALAQQFFDKIGAADAVIISFAEHNGSYSAAYKNIFDWASRIDSKVFQGKPMLMLSTAPGKGGAKSVLASATQSAPHFNADLRASLSVPSFYENFDSETGLLKSEELNNALAAVVQMLQADA